MTAANTGDVQRQQRLLQKQQTLLVAEGIYWQRDHALFSVVSFGSNSLLLYISQHGRDKMEPTRITANKFRPFIIFSLYGTDLSVI